MVRIATVLLLLACGPLRAHPVPKDNHDRIIIVRPTPTALVIDYRLEVDEFRAFQDIKDTDDLLGLTDARKFPAVYLRAMAPVLANNLIVKLDGKELDITTASTQVSFSGHIRCDCRFEARWALDPGKRHSFTFEEKNFGADTRSRIHVILAASPLLKAEDVKAPGDELLALPPEKYTPDIHKVSCVLLASPDSLPGVARPALPPDAASRPRAIFRSADAKPLAGVPHAIGRVGPSQQADGEPNGQGRRLLDLLFDTRSGIAVLLVLAALFGAAHALTPGHGKTMVAAYLIGERGTVWHAVVLGIVTTLTHTSSVMALAVALLFFPGTDRAAVQSALGLVGGLLIAGTGLWLLMQRLANRADHVHLDTGQPTIKPGWWQRILLGISGGLVPCWDAILLLGVAISKHKLWLGLPLLLAFSAGLAAVLVAVGIAVVKARGLLSREKERADGSSEVSLGRWDAFLDRAGRVLPVVSALVIVGIGLWMCFASAGHVD